ncbi:transposase [Flammeovirga pectinis]|uniref:Transposase n=1 Tax=Flammeovirga pectinis TaxID=2494373 RepID=A0A3Q9FUW1_9BACT|nr:transposase [Flammeovirga pectinis]AZQ64956.1 transposase [Flammeovirga pectinis]
MKSRQSYRLTGWDYRRESDYFITICAKDFKCIFGTIENQKMTYSPLGILAEIFWYQIPIFNSNIKLGSYVIMPNHIHGILHCTENNSEVDDLVNYPQAVSHNSKISPKKSSISTIIRTYKSSVTKHSRRLGYDFEWQPRFYDHIIRDNKNYERIELYIEQNIITWSNDRFYPK